MNLLKALQGPEFDTFLINKVRVLLHEDIDSEQEALEALISKKPANTALIMSNRI